MKKKKGFVTLEEGRNKNTAYHTKNAVKQSKKVVE